MFRFLTSTDRITIKCLPPNECEPLDFPVEKTKSTLASYILDNAIPTEPYGFVDYRGRVFRWLTKLHKDFLLLIAEKIYGYAKYNTWEKVLDNGGQIIFTIYKDEHIHHYDFY